MATQLRWDSGPLGGDCWIGRFSADLSALTAATLYGGTAEERPCYGLAERSDGGIVIAGVTQSDSQIATAGTLFASHPAGATNSGFVAVLSADLTTRIAGTYLGGPGDATMRGGVRVLANGDLLSFGQVNGAGLGTVGVVQPSPSGGGNEAWIGVLSPDLTSLRWGTYLGSSSSQFTEVIVGTQQAANGELLALGSSPGTTWLAGMRSHGAVPMGANQSKPYVVRLSANGQSVVWFSVLGPGDGVAVSGEAYQEPGMATDAMGNVIVVGEALNNMGSVGSYQASQQGNGDCFVCKVGTDGSLHWCTHVGGAGADRCISPQVGPGGRILIAGTTASANLCAGATETLNSTHSGGADAFVAILSADGSRLEWCTLLGGAADEVGRWLVLRADGMVALTGMTQSADFPTTAGAYDTSYNGNEDMFVATFRLPAWSE